MSEEELGRAVRRIYEAGYQLEAEAFLNLKRLTEKLSPNEIVETMLEILAQKPQPPAFINAELVKEAAEKLESRLKEALEPLEPEISEKRVFKPKAKDFEAEVEVLRDPSRSIASRGEAENFLKYFKDRFTKLRKLLLQRLDCRDATTVSEALAQPQGSKVKFICIVSEKISRVRRIILRVEDFESSISVLVQPSTQSLEVFSKAEALLLDQVVCISGVKAGGALVIADDIMLPEVPQHKPNQASEPVCALLISDIHIGSRFFEEKLFGRLLAWLRGEIGNHRLREAAGRVKYVVIAGDLVDGVGVYPEQETELSIPDIYRQYVEASRLLEEIPDHIQLIVIPGNHDASRKALPQPALSRSFAEPIYKLGRRVISLGNPSLVKLHGVTFLLHHGRSLEDVLAWLPEANHHEPAKAMIALLRARHLAPIYGQRTPIAPEPVDWMVIDKVPDVYHAGHIHVYGQTVYRGVRVVNSGCWQGQTSYQLRLGLMPTPGIAALVDLQTLNVTPLDFKAL